MPPPPAEGRPRRADVVYLASLVAFPLAGIGALALTGHLLLGGDNLTQNYPLRALVGSQLRHGHLPLWNPWIWSGTPLLGGFNAGALYPLTLLFAVLPAPAAWAAGQIATFAVAGTGLYAFLRHRRLAPAAAWAGAFAWSFAGFMVAHLVHTGLMEAMGWTGWILLALDHLAGPDGAGRAAWAGGLGLFGGMVALAGDPRGLSNVVIVAGMYAGWLLVRHRGRRLRLAGWVLGGAAVAAAIGAAQYLPGLAAQHASQRAVAAYPDFAAGSMLLPLLVLLVFPFLLGGFDSLRLAPYAANYNLPEVSGYIGLLAMAGALAALGGGRRRRGRRRKPCPAGAPAGAGRDGEAARRPGRGFWALLGVTGVVLALGGNTPVGHALYRIPLYGGQRLQSRNLGLVDLAVAVLFARWADGFLRAEGRPPPAARMLGLVAPFVVIGTTVSVLLAPGVLESWSTAITPILPRAWPFVAVSLGLAVAVAAVMLGGHRLAPGRRLAALVALTALDAGFFFANGAYGVTATSALGAAPGSASATVAALVPAGERFALVDPLVVYTGYVLGRPDLVGPPDLNILYRTASVQGYGSIVSARYEAATAAHFAGHLDPAVLAGPAADRLRLALVLAPPDEALGDLGGVLQAPRWRYWGMVGGLMAFRNTDPLPPAWVEGSGGTTVPGAGAHAAPADADTGAQTVVVASPRPGTLVRSTAWDAGWRYRIRPAAGGSPADGGGSGWCPVGAAGGLQAVPVPPGRWSVDYRYRPRRALAGMATAAVGTLAAAALLSGAWLRRRRATPPR